MLKIKSRKLFIVMTCLFLFSLFQFTHVHAEQNNENSAVQEEVEQIEENELPELDEEQDLTNEDVVEDGELTDDSVIEDGGLIEEELNSPVVHFESKVLMGLIAKELDIENRPITEADMEELTELSDHTEKGEAILSLVGLEYAINLESLSLGDRQITDISPIGGLTNLEYIGLENNLITDIGPIANLTKLYTLNFGDNLITDISPIANLTKLNTIDFRNNLITDLSPLAKLTDLFYIIFENNRITDISVIENLQNLGNVWLQNNFIEDITPITKVDSVWTILLNNNKINDITPLRDYDVMSRRIHMANNPFKVDDETISILIKNFIEQLTFNIDGVPHFYIWEVGICSYDPDTWSCLNDDIFQWEEWHEYFSIFDGFSEQDRNITYNYAILNEPLKLNAEQINYLKKHNTNIIISAEDVTLTIPSSAFEQSSNGALIDIKKLEEVENSVSATYDFTISQGDKIISTFTEGIQLSFDVDVKQVSNLNHLNIFHLNEKTNEWEGIKSQYKDGKVIATTNHFSTFTVFEQEINEPVEDEEADENTSKEDKESNEIEKPVNKEEQPVNKENETDDNQTNSTDENNVENIKSEDKQAEEKKLPNTASNMYNFLIAGVIFILLSVIIIFTYTRRKVS